MRARIQRRSVCSAQRALEQGKAPGLQLCGAWLGYTGQSRRGLHTSGDRTRASLCVLTRTSTSVLQAQARRLMGCCPGHAWMAAPHKQGKRQLQLGRSTYLDPHHGSPCRCPRSWLLFVCTGGSGIRGPALVPRLCRYPGGYSGEVAVPPSTWDRGTGSWGQSPPCPQLTPGCMDTTPPPLTDACPPP